MEKIYEKIRKKEEQIKNTEERLKKYKQQLKNYEQQKEDKKIADLIKTIKSEGLQISEAKELLKGSNTSTQTNNETEEENKNSF